MPNNKVISTAAYWTLLSVLLMVIYGCATEDPYWPITFDPTIDYYPLPRPAPAKMTREATASLMNDGYCAIGIMCYYDFEPDVRTNIRHDKMLSYAGEVGGDIVQINKERVEDVTYTPPRPGYGSIPPFIPPHITPYTDGPAVRPIPITETTPSNLESTTVHYIYLTVWRRENSVCPDTHNVIKEHVGRSHGVNDMHCIDPKWEWTPLYGGVKAFIRSRVAK
jgi:hypothetical protein